MALNFPNSPTIGQTYTDTTSGFSYEWDGTVWKSYSPASASNIKILDDLQTSFNGSTQTFALTSSGVALLPANAQSLLISIGGVVQEPGVDYTVNSTNITFTTAPTADLSFSGVSLGPAVPVTYANDGNIYIRNTYTGAGTTGPFAFTQGYTVGYLDVYRNGVRLISGTDFVGTSGTNFFLTDAAAVNDELEAIGYTITSIINASTSFDNLNVTGITTTGRLNVSTNAVVTGILTAGNTVVGGATTQLVVVGNARITGILSIGQGTVTIDGSNNQVNVGTAVTIHHTNGFQVGGNSLHSTGISVNNINSSGIVTATTFSGNITGTAATFTGNVSIAGTLTYEDVTNVDSVGLVTARTGVRINTGGLVVTAGVSTFSDTTDFKGATETVSVGSTYLISSGRIILECDAQNGTVFTHTLSTGDNVGIVSLRNFPVTKNSVTTFSIIFTQNAAGTGNTTAATGIGTNITLTPLGVSGFSTSARVATASTVTLSTTGSDVDIVTLAIHYNGSGTGTPGNYRVFATNNSGYRLGTIRP